MSPSSGKYRPGRQLVQVPGPTNVPGIVLAAIAQPTLDHRGPEFAELVLGLLTDVRSVFDTTSPVVMFAGSGTGAWESTITNTLSRGDRVLSIDTGQFATLWASMARDFGLTVDVIETDWRHPIDPNEVAGHLAADSAHEIKAVFVTHNETSTGVTSDVVKVREAMDLSGHPAMLFVDAVSSLVSIEYHHDAWRVDVTICGSQKGLMLPPGLALCAISDRALEASTTSDLSAGYWRWGPVLEQNASGFFPYTPPTNLLFGLRAALDAIEAEGLGAIWERHRRHAAATRAAVHAWGLELQCLDPAAYSPTVTAVRMPEGYREDEFRAIVREAYGMALGSGLGRIAGKVFRIGHLGDFDDLSLVAALGGVELGLAKAKIPHSSGGVSAALEELART